MGKAAATQRAVGAGVEVPDQVRGCVFVGLHNIGQRPTWWTLRRGVWRCVVAARLRGMQIATLQKRPPGGGRPLPGDAGRGFGCLEVPDQVRDCMGVGWVKPTDVAARGFHPLYGFVAPQASNEFDIMKTKRSSLIPVSRTDEPNCGLIFKLAPKRTQSFRL